MSKHTPVDMLRGQIDIARPEKRLWIADEQPLDKGLLALLAAAQCVLMSNRIEQVQAAQAVGIEAYFTDYRFSDLPCSQWDQIFFRVCKERPVIHYVLNQAASYLSDRGLIYMAGYKNEGIKTHGKAVKKRLGGEQSLIKGDKQSSMFITGIGQSGEPLDDKNYTELRDIACVQQQAIKSKPGLYGWQKIDLGSQCLVDALAMLDTPNQPVRVLDLGCGYGYLSIALLEQVGWSINRLVAVDNCAAAIHAAKVNLAAVATQPLTWDVIASDAGRHVQESFDWIVCNPPFHQGFTTTPDLHVRMLNTAQRCLSAGGNAVFVVNSFLPLEKYADDIGFQVKTLMNNQSFKVLLLS